jgi:glycosyltransferase involved in cell wall biosynthesis
MEYPTIVVVAYNRKNSLKRLLSSIEKADYPNKKITLVISVDCDPKNPKMEEEIVNIAEKFQWKQGRKILLKHTKKDLKNHIFACGDLTYAYNTVLILEDDLFVSRYFYMYALDALEFYQNDNNIAGIALYNHSYNETKKIQFRAIDDAYDTYFMKLTCSWGQVFTRKQWYSFREWQFQNIDRSKILLPHDISCWPTSSWKKEYTQYLIHQEKYFVYPRVSYTTNFCEPGENMKGNEQYKFKIPIAHHYSKQKFVTLNNSPSRYDAFCQLEQNP